MASHLKLDLVRVVVLLWICTTLSTTTAQNMSLPGCPSRCGNLSIPYPFGIGTGCYLEKGYEILCKPNNTADEAFLGITGSKIVELSLDQVRIAAPPATLICGEALQGPINSLNLSGPFTYSSTQNKLTVVGCNVLSYISNSQNNRYISGCVSVCGSETVNVTVPVTGSCFGIGCCQSTIPSRLKSFSLSLASINTPSPSLASNSNCSTAVFHDGDPVGLFNRSLGESLDTVLRTSTVALDWSVGSASCEDDISFACGPAAECVNSTTGVGHRCSCSWGYEGNPYLPSGCQDIDECKTPIECDNGSFCRNQNGSYICECLQGYGWMINTTGNGTGCYPLPDCPKGYEMIYFTDGSWCSPVSDSRLSKTKVALIGIGASVGLLLLLGFAFWIYKKLAIRKQIKLKEKNFKKNGGLLLEQQLSSEGSIDKTKIFLTHELEKATDSFNESRILGKGGSGTVYKGMLTDGRIVAIKKSKIVDETQTVQFINELVILSQINHKHVVKLLGCCLETEVPLLVYEYISNGTLSYHIHDQNGESSISWADRLRISKEIAGALSYLHSSASTPIYHRDIKSSNILLDEHYRTTVSDFGISRSVPYEKTHLTTLVQGTFGYLDPEYFHTGQFTEKSDVYSFGVVLVELLTGQRPISFARSEEEHNLAMHFISSVKQGRLSMILDRLVLNEAGKEEVFVVAKLAKRCLKLVGKKRPTMKEVLGELEGLRNNNAERPLIYQNYQEANFWVDEQASLTITGPL